MPEAPKEEGASQSNFFQQRSDALARFPERNTLIKEQFHVCN